jgi:nucleoid-associated protein YgaU
VIEAGDNLSSIAEQYLGSNDPAAIQRLIAANPQISDTNLIHPGEIVHVPSEENQPDGG